MVDLPGYESADALLRNGLFAVARGRRVRDAKPVLLKTPARLQPERDDLDALEREYALLRELPLPGLPRALDLVRAAGTGCLVLEDRGLRPLPDLLLESRPDFPAILRIGIQLCTLLGELHDRNVVHGGIRPSGLLVSGDYAQLQLLDFGFAWRTSLDSRAPTPVPLLAAGVAAYMSPEQTGRMSRGIDHRTDFYSLGATLYELLTGTPPFTAADPLELIHCHIARSPLPPSASAAVPEQLSHIVVRLLAKTAEERYESALGIRRDLEICEREWRARQAIPLFPLGRHDVSERFLLPQRLYGREQELADLTASFQEACGGRTGLLLVSGYPGIGKTALISELYRPIVRQRGYFVAGKFDQVTRSVPYGALIQAFRGLVWQLLTESEERLSLWRQRLGVALGPNGGVLAEVIPDIEFIIGKQQPAPPLDPVEAQNRFRYVFQSFVGTIADGEHPLVLFLDDLQWADTATLHLIRALLTASDIRHLLVIGAYRDNEVDEDHPLTATIAQLDLGGAEVRRLSLAPLAGADVAALLSDALRCQRTEVEPLAALIVQKTDGNPFFVIQFLKALHQDGQFRFDRERGRWTFRLDAIAAAGMTDNVIALMTGKIRRLTLGCQQVLMLAACIGNPFDWSTFLTVTRQPLEEAVAGLSEAVDSGLLQPVGTPYEVASGRPPRAAAYAFLHDRVQQAAYALIPGELSHSAHLDVGRLLLAEAGRDVPDERLFEIVNHLNIGRSLIADPAERLELARLNLAAGRRAKSSAAYHAAAGYLGEGLALVSDEHWGAEYDLLFGLYLEAAECQYLSGQFDAAERYFELLLARAVRPRDRASVHSLRIVLYENLSRYADALSSGREGLALFGISFPQRHEDASALVDADIDGIRRLLGDRSIASLVNLPQMTDPDMRMVLRILTSLWAPAYLSGDRLLTSLISSTMVRLSLAHGNTEDSAYGYVTHAITIGPDRRDYAAAYAWGELALAVNQRFDDRKRRAKIHQQFQAHVKLWRKPFDTCIPHAREARRSGLDAGDFTYAGYGAVTESWPALIISRTLDRFVSDHTPTLALLDRIRMPDFKAALRVMLNWAAALQGRTAAPLSLSDAEFDEREFIATYETAAPFFLTFVYVARLHLSVLLGATDAALDAAERARAVTVSGTVWPVLVDFWGGLALAMACDREGTGETRAWRDQVKRSATALKDLADSCPENFRCFSLLLTAELERLEGRPDRALRLYEETIAYARLTRNLQQEALASERCATLWLALGRGAAAAPLLAEAHRGYAAWGAISKTRQLEQMYGDLLPAAASRSAAAGHPNGALTVPRFGASLDMATVIKVAQAVAVEIELDDLLRKLMKLALENAGADRGLFLQERGGRLTVEAEAAADRQQVAVRMSIPWEDAQLASSVVRYVRRTGQDVVTGNAALDERFAGDTYISRSGAKSILCVPVGQQGRPGGVLYLENGLVTDAFTPERIEMMRVLAAQAAISLENAQLYDEMKREVARRTAAEQALRDALAELELLKNRLEAENVYLQEEISIQHNFNEIVGNSPALLQALHRVERVAPTDSTVLIVGETGSGKELFARAVHSRSRRQGRPLVKVNCGAIPPGLVESELFGHVKGAFTGAVDKRVGRFELAHGGTIFLDEIGELPPEAQVKLLRVLQEHEFEPVGSSRTLRVDVRVIAATNRNLEHSVRDGTFRADLLYRLNVFPIEVPPLRQRKSDIRLLVEFFVVGLARRVGKPLQGFSARSLERMLHYSWPGNIRELQNVVERAAILSAGPVLELDRALLEPAPAEGPPTNSGTLDDVQRAAILSALKATRGVVEGPAGAATVLGIHPNTLRSRMKKLGIGGSRRSS